VRLICVNVRPCHDLSVVQKQCSSCNKQRRASLFYGLSICSRCRYQSSLPSAAVASSESPQDAATLSEPTRKRKRVDEEQHEARGLLIQKLSAKTRSLKPWEELSSHSERWERLQLLHLCCTALAMPSTIVQSTQQKTPAAAVAHLDNKILKQIRDVLPVPSFNTIAAVREQLANAAGMRTASFTQSTSDSSPSRTLN